MDKVKVSSKIAQAIKLVSNMDIIAVLEKSMTMTFDGELSVLNTVLPRTLSKALVNGYEIEVD